MGFYIYCLFKIKNKLVGEKLDRQAFQWNHTLISWDSIFPISYLIRVNTFFTYHKSLLHYYTHYKICIMYIIPRIHLSLLCSFSENFNAMLYFSGTAVFFQPGMLAGGSLEHECNPQRAIGYYLEGLVCLAPFTKKPLRALLRGVTNDQTDPSVSCGTSCLFFI